MNSKDSLDMTAYLAMSTKLTRSLAAGSARCSHGETFLKNFSKGLSSDREMSLRSGALGFSAAEFERQRHLYKGSVMGKDTIPKIISQLWASVEIV